MCSFVKYTIQRGGSVLVRELKRATFKMRFSEVYTVLRRRHRYVQIYDILLFLSHYHKLLMSDMLDSISIFNSKNNKRFMTLKHK